MLPFGLARTLWIRRRKNWGARAGRSGPSFDLRLDFRRVLLRPQDLDTEAPVSARVSA